MNGIGDVNRVVEMAKKWAQSAESSEILRVIDHEVAALRFAEGLRRNWEAARAEAHVHTAWAEAHLGGSPAVQGSSLVNGAPMTLGELRRGAQELADHPDAGAGDGDIVLASRVENPALHAGLDALRAQLWVAHTWPDLNTTRPSHSLTGVGMSAPMRYAGSPVTGGARGRAHAIPLAQTVAGIHRCLTAHLATDGVIAMNQVAIPQHPEALRDILTIVESDMPILVRTGIAVAWSHAHPVFDVADAPVWRTLARDLLTTSGWDPTGTVLMSVAWLERGTSVSDVLARSLSDAQGVEQWLTEWVSILSTGIAAAQTMITHVQAHEPQER